LDEGAVPKLDPNGEDDPHVAEDSRRRSRHDVLAGVIMVQRFLAMPDRITRVLNLSLTVFVMASVAFILLWAASRWVAVMRGVIPTKTDV
jgi:hypothetical protein